jgi:urease accessory protein
MAWQANLDLNYTLRGSRVVVHHEHNGPLRVLQSLYPEGDGVCHNVLVHPPGGLVGGDTLDIRVQVGPGCHGLITTPGATRFYRSEGPWALQRTRLQLATGARLEWLPMEALCYNDCRAENQLTMEVETGAELIGWDITALGLPQAKLPFESGIFRQHIEVPGIWLERATLMASDQRLRNSPAGLGGNNCLASLFLVSGTALDRNALENLLEATRVLIAQHPSGAWAGVTSPDPRVVVLRMLSPLTEPATQLLRAARDIWRQQRWQRAPCTPRLWAM